MAADLNEWTLAFGRDTAGCLPSATFYPEPGLAGIGLGDDWLRRVCRDNPVAMFGPPSAEAVGGG